MFRKLFLSLALFVFTLTACELQEPVDSIPVLAADGAHCEHELRTVDLQSDSIAPSDYMVTLETGTYTVEHCMCRMISYQLYVSLNSTPQWKLTLAPNLQVLFDAASMETETELLIEDVESIFHYLGTQENGKLYSTAFGNFPVRGPLLNRASGLCIVENYDGSNPGGTVASLAVGTQANGPVIQVRTGPLPGSYFVVVYVPVGITNPA